MPSPVKTSTRGLLTKSWGKSYQKATQRLTELKHFISFQVYFSLAVKHDGADVHCGQVSHKLLCCSM